MVTSIVTMNECLESEEDYIIQNAVQSYVAPFVDANYGGPPIEAKKRCYIERDRDGACEILMNDYFVDRPLYPEAMFRRRFRMHRSVFLRIVEGVAAQESYFQQGPDATGKLGATAIHKCTAALRMLAYGTSADSADEYLKIAGSTTRKCLKHFVRGVRKAFTEQYLRRPTVNDLQRLLRNDERRGFPGMMDSIDCMHWEWKNCPRAWRGLYQGRNKSATAVFIPAIRLPLSQEDELFTKRQESVRKDVERAFGVLQARFAIIQRPTRVLNEGFLWEIMLTCIILHNMIVEDERDTYQNYQDITEFEEESIQGLGETSSRGATRSFTVQPGRYNNLSLQQYMQRRTEAWDRDSHNALQRDLVQHIWQHTGGMYDN
ncbi:uncharacterized protein LOC141587380 [Silene latifolia]|uniref:uncharacterized protein LOC141587380 n=1 Tax=Silene latifolia TaxID=37657 RepID=UPI003D76C683